MKIKNIKPVGPQEVVELTVSLSTYIDKSGIISHNCKHCEELHLLSDRITPRVYKMSELQATPGDWKDPKPSIGPVHPHCRCQLTTLMPGYGFNDSGKITYIGEGHDEYKKQKG